MIVYTSGRYLQKILALHPDLALRIEYLLSKEGQRGESLSPACMQPMDPLEMILSFPPGTEIAVSSENFSKEMAELSEIRDDLKYINIDDVCWRIEQKKRQIMLAGEQSRKLPRIFWISDGKELSPYAPFRSNEMVISENQAIQGTIYRGMPVCAPEVLRDLGASCYVIVLTGNYDRVKSVLQRYGREEYRDFISGSVLRQLPDKPENILICQMQKKALMNETKGIKVSVIMPSLNVATYIRQAVESVMRQTLKDIEILCVDSGSTDGTLEIIEELAGQDSRIRIISSDLRSYGHQINLGLEAAKGEYVGIVEADDWVLPRMYEEQYLAAKGHNVDFLRADRYIFQGEGIRCQEHEYVSMIEAKGQRNMYGKVFNPAETMKSFYWGINTTSGIFRRSFMEEHRIRLNESPGASFQDNGLFFQTMAHARRVFIMPRAYYMIRRDRPDSSVFDKKNVAAIRGEYEFIKQALAREGSNRFWEPFYWAKYANYLWRLNSLLPDLQEDFLLEIVSEYRQEVAGGDIPREIVGRGILLRLQRVAANPSKYYRERVLPNVEFEQILGNFSDAIIYGTGNPALETMEKLIYRANPLHLIAFAKAEDDGEKRSIHGVPLLGIDSLLEYKEKTLVIIADQGGKREKIEEMLRYKGFNHIARQG